MTLFSMAIRNLQRNFKGHFVYFASMIFSITIYFLFKTLQYSSQVEQATSAGMPIGQGIGELFKVSSVVLIIFVSIFIIYSNEFFIRKRKKEVGLYSLLGIRKKQIARMLFVENMLMSLFALLIGMGIGGLLSKVSLQLLVYVTELELNMHMEMPLAAVMDTIIIFLLIMSYTSLQGYHVMYRFQLIELFSAERQGEVMPKGSVPKAVSSIFLISSGYFFALMFIKTVQHTGLGATGALPIALYILLATILGTFLLFQSFTVFVLQKVRNRKASFYNGINIITTSQLLYRIKGNAKSLAIITVLSAVTLTAVNNAFIMYYNTFKNAKDNAPYSYSYEKQNEALDTKVNKILDKEKQIHPVMKQFEIEMIPWKGDSKERYQLMSVSMFNDIPKLRNESSLTLNHNEAFVIEGNTSLDPSSVNHYFTNRKDILTFHQEKYEVQIKGATVQRITNLGELVLVIPDQLYNQAKQIGELRIVKNISVKDENDSAMLTEKLQKIMPMPVTDPTSSGPELSNFESFYMQYHIGLMMNGLFIFCGFFLGVVFLLATGSIIYFKQIAEAHADRERYTILQKVGVTKTEMKRTIAKQMGFIFSIPLLVGICHSIVATLGVKGVLGSSLLGVNPMFFSPLIISTGVYSLIYVVYYFLTVRSYYKIVSVKE
ncbi:ABC transporter permease [Bacillus thuringiensis]|uniref:ABC transporter permease n=1 Tax=Bacillus thuringiensis TaxID=1428 RepID=A0ABD6RVD3_BACTU|nr:ABC transporter permease [Bacillus thuringiensis]PER37522.1 ABC transporter permease [Bacillus thuringiensis]PEU69468.1 ABC transporter permease [Bacillus thuringiensis]PFI05195.1 ABC transporter permease [Bacillus thuringiensis]PFW34419.1 ABC transporter permease [Bacillus thuringiensis]PGY64048.1 ABC transporter permease [Bacillus thuringiensis]